MPSASSTQLIAAVVQGLRNAIRDLPMRNKHAHSWAVLDVDTIFEGVIRNAVAREFSRLLQVRGKSRKAFTADSDTPIVHTIVCRVSARWGQAQREGDSERWSELDVYIIVTSKTFVFCY